MTTSMRWWFAAFVVAVFFAGTSAGVIVDRLWLVPRDFGAGPAAVTGARGGAVPLDGIVELNARRLQNRLRLTDEQTEAIRPMLEGWQQRVAALQRTTRDQLLTEVDRLEQELAAVLTPEQQERLSLAREGLLMPAPARGRRGGRGGPFGRGSPNAE